MTARCLETRRTPEGFRRRRYEQDGVRFTTIEVPIEVWEKATGRSRPAPLKDQALALLAAGWKPEAVAHELSLESRTVRRWKKTL